MSVEDQVHDLRARVARLEAAPEPVSPYARLKAEFADYGAIKRDHTDYAAIKDGAAPTTEGTD